MSWCVKCVITQRILKMNSSNWLPTLISRWQSSHINSPSNWNVKQDHFIDYVMFTIWSCCLCFCFKIHTFVLLSRSHLINTTDGHDINILFFMSYSYRGYVSPFSSRAFCFFINILFVWKCTEDIKKTEMGGWLVTLWIQVLSSKRTKCPVDTVSCLSLCNYQSSIWVNHECLGAIHLEQEWRHGARI